MPYRICKVFEVENAHVLSKHPELCRYPHGHSRRIEVVLRAESLNENDMVCDFKALKLAVQAFIDSFDHALCVNSQDRRLSALQEAAGERLVVFENVDPTTEVMARKVFDHIREAIARDTRYTSADGQRTYRIGAQVKLERVRIWETRTSWAEYAL